jgi:hypothetical protein
LAVQLAPPTGLSLTPNRPISQSAMIGKERGPVEAGSRLVVENCTAAPTMPSSA